MIKRYLIFVVLCLMYVMTFIIVYAEWFKKLMLNKECQFNLPKKYKLVKSIGTNKYAIMYNDEYLRFKYNSSEIESFILPENATTFKDSCIAKSMAKKHYQQELNFKFEQLKYQFK